MPSDTAGEGGPLVVLATPTYTKPHPAYIAAMEAAVPALEAAGINHKLVFEIGSPYISAARATMLRKALDGGAQTIVFIDHDLSFRPDDLVRLIQTPGDVIAGTYRFKTPNEDYMGSIETQDDGRPIVRDDGCVRADKAPAGFLKVTKAAVARFAWAYPHLLYGDPLAPAVDLFNHGAHDGLWYGEDYAFCRNWKACGGEIWLIPDLNLNHHSAEDEFRGNFHTYLRRQPGGDLA